MLPDNPNQYCCYYIPNQYVKFKIQKSPKVAHGGGRMVSTSGSETSVSSSTPASAIIYDAYTSIIKHKKKKKKNTIAFLTTENIICILSNIIKKIFCLNYFCKFFSKILFKAQTGG